MTEEHELSSNPLLLTIPEAAKRLSLSPAKLYELIARRKGPPVIHIGRAARIAMHDLRAWTDQQPRE
ncbi:MAG: helix-turn-helix domain-containing protein [Ktedonobacteraceae bacterium]